MNDAQQPFNALPQGHRLQEYELVRVLGFGGFGMTYLGFDHNLDKAVAIKEYLPSDIATRTSDNSVVPQASQFQSDFEWGLDRFLDEARALARFDHRHIIKVYRFFEAHGTAYIVMEYAEGETLSAFLEHKGMLSEAELKAILYPLLDGLEMVHGADFLHRDIKPGNIIIRDEDHSPVLLDFGSARQAIGARSRSVTSIITPGYAPIEQYSSRGNQGPWTDIYALGGVCYRALTGEVPDDATDRMRDDPLIPVVERCAGQASAGFLSAIDWALQVDEADRPQSIAEWRAKLEGEHVVHSPPHEDSSISVVPIEEASTPSAVSQSVTPESEQQGKKRGKVLLGVLGVCLLLTGLGGYLWWEKKNHEAEIERYVAQFEEALGRKDFSMAGIYVDSIRAVDVDAPMLSELDDRLSKARQDEEVVRKVSELLSGAAEDMATDRLTSPTGQNAWEKYQAVLELESGHGVATAGLDSIIARYVMKFKSVLGRKDFSMAGEYVARIRAVDPNAPMLSELEGRLLASRQAESRRQEQIALESRRQEQGRSRSETHSADRSSETTDNPFSFLEVLQKNPDEARKERERAVPDRELPQSRIDMDNRKTRALERGGLQLSTYAWDYAPYMQYLKRHIDRHIYPPRTFELGIIDGTTRVKFRIWRDGRLEGPELIDYEGHNLLRDTSLKAVELSAPFKALPPDFPDEYLEIVGTFEYLIFRKGQRR